MPRNTTTDKYFAVHVTEIHEVDHATRAGTLYIEDFVATVTPCVA